MADALSDYLEGKIIDHILRTSAFTKPANIYLALFTTAPTDVAGSGVEVSGGSYARVACGPLDADWAAPVAGSGQSSNLVSFTFPAPTANWGTIVAAAIFDALTVGNMLLRGTLVASKTVNNGDAAPS